jgi:hypothetical protein
MNQAAQPPRGAPDGGCRPRCPADVPLESLLELGSPPLPGVAALLVAPGKIAATPAAAATLTADTATVVADSRRRPCSRAATARATWRAAARLAATSS